MTFFQKLRWCVPIDCPLDVARAGGPKVHLDDLAPVQVAHRLDVVVTHGHALLYKEPDVGLEPVHLIVLFGQRVHHPLVAPVHLHVGEVVVVEGPPQLQGRAGVALRAHEQHGQAEVGRVGPKGHVALPGGGHPLIELQGELKVGLGEELEAAAAGRGQGDGGEGQQQEGQEQQRRRQDGGMGPANHQPEHCHKSGPRNWLADMALSLSLSLSSRYNRTSTPPGAVSHTLGPATHTSGPPPPPPPRWGGRGRMEGQPLSSEDLTALPSSPQGSFRLKVFDFSTQNSVQQRTDEDSRSALGHLELCAGLYLHLAVDNHYCSFLHSRMAAWNCRKFATVSVCIL